MHSPVRAEAAAVHALGVAISRYAEHVRSITEEARRSAVAVERRMTELKEQRRQELDIANRGLELAQQALAACCKGCGPLIAALAEAQGTQQRASHAYQVAARAADVATAAARELSISIQSVESVIAGQSSVATAALQDLEARLREIADANPNHASWIKNTLGGIGIGIQITHAAGVAIEPLKPVIAPPRSDVTIARQDQEYLAEQQLLWAHSELKQAEERYNRVQRESGDYTSHPQDGL